MKTNELITSRQPSWVKFYTRFVMMRHRRRWPAETYKLQVMRRCRRQQSQQRRRRRGPTRGGGQRDKGEVTQ